MRLSISRRAAHNASALAAILTLALMLVIAAGCGEENQSGNGAQTSGSTSTETPVPAPKPDPGTPVAEEQPAPYGSGSSASQSVGMLIDGLQLINVRWADHGTYYRVVFDLGTPEGDPVLQVPHAEASLTPDGMAIKVTLSGIRSIGDADSAKATDLQLGDSMVLSIKRLPAMDDQALVYEIRLSAAGTFTLVGLGSPGRIVIDINKS